MKIKSISVYIWTIAFSGLFAGGCITVLFILIPYWHTLQPAALINWFHDFGAIVGITMLPMEVIPLLLCMYAWFLAKKVKQVGTDLWLWVNLSNIMIIVLLFVYFLPVNLKFLNETMNPADVPDELARWEFVHLGRTALALLSTVLAILACSKYIRSIATSIKSSH